MLVHQIHKGDVSHYQLDLLISELGPGWIPAVLNSELEYNYIEEEQRALMNRQDYFISGSTRTIGTIDFENYLPYQIGNG